MVSRLEFIKSIHNNLLEFVKASETDTPPEKSELIRVADDSFVAVVAFMHEENTNTIKSPPSRDEIYEMGKLWSDIPVFCQYLWKQGDVLNERQKHINFFRS